MANTFKFGNGEWAVGKETALAYNDENGNFKPLPFTFDRASTATVVNKDGLIETVGTDEPRIDFLNNTNGHLLLEPSRTNSITYSEDFSQSVWGTWQSTKTLSNNINPKGINGYYEISHTGSSSNNPNTRLTNVSLNGSYTLSFFVKINQSRYISLSIEDYDGDRASVYFDTINKTFTTISNVGSPITNTSYSEFSNDWIRISLSVNLLNAVYNEVGIGIYNPSGSFPSASGEVISVFGSQLEAGSYATSYIPTSGQSGGVTRSADNTKIVNSPILQATNQFTLFFDAKDFVNYGATFFNIMFTLGAGESPYDAGSGIHIYNKIWYYFNGSSAVTLGSCYNETTDSKFAISYDGTKYTRYANGVKLGTNTVSASMSNWDTLTNGNLSYSGVDRVFDLADLKLYDTALTDQEAIALTQV